MHLNENPYNLPLVVQEKIIKTIPIVHQYHLDYEYEVTNKLAQIFKLKPENIILIGIRSFEAPEQKLLQKLGVKVLMMEDVHKRGFQHCYAEALKYFEDKKLSFGVSFDLDGLDPRYLGALGTPVEDGIVLEEVLKAFKSMPKKHFIGLEIAEYNPSLDKNDKGIGVIKNILSALAGEDYFLLRNYCNMGSVEA